MALKQVSDVLAGGVKDDFMCISLLYVCIFKESPLYFLKAHALRYRYRKCLSDLMYISREWAFRKSH